MYLRVVSVVLCSQKWDDVVFCNTKWSPGQDDQLVRFAFTVATARSKPMMEVTSADLSSSTAAVSSVYVLKDFTPDELAARFATLKLFNMQLSRCIGLIDMTNTQDSWVLGFKLRQLGHCIFSDTKQRLVDDAMESTWSDGECGLSVTLDNQAAFQSMEAGLCDPSRSRCLFVQGFQRLAHGTGEQFRAKVRALM